MKVTNQDEALKQILEKFNKIEDKISALETRIKEGPQVAGSGGDLTSQLVDNLTLVGLKEAITWQRRSIRYAWAIVLFLGLVATSYYICSITSEYLENPTATKVALVRPTEYVYPPLILCPGTWLDTRKALTMGLTIDALKYSIAYMDYFAVDKSTNVETARESFYKFYEAHNFSCLLDYFKAITVDLQAVDSPALLADNPNSSFMCCNCEEKSPMEKVFVGDSMCYAFFVQPADALHYRQWSTAPHIWMKVQDRTENVTETTPNWRAYLTPDQHLTQPNFPPIAVEPFSVTTLKTRAEKFITLGDRNHFCYQSDQVSVEYSAERCIIQCLHELLKESFKCHIFWYRANDNFESPPRYCNYFDTVSDENISFFDSFDDIEMKIINSREGASCIEKCPYRCDRTVYTTTLDSKYTISLDGYNLTIKAKQQNMSLVVVSLDNTAISQGGIFTLTEVNTFSFSALVSNVGGTLGIFVGGTVMTFFQLIMFLVNYCLDIREKKSKKEDRVSDSDVHYSEQMRL